MVQWMAVPSTLTMPSFRSKSSVPVLPRQYDGLPLLRNCAILIGVHGGCHEELPTYFADGRILVSHGFPWIVSGSLAPLDYTDVSVN